MSKFLKSLLAIALCMLLCLSVVASLSGLTAFAAEDESEESEEVDIWDIKSPAYMSVSFSSVKTRILGNTSLDQLVLYVSPTINIPYAMYVDVLTGEVIVLRCKDPVNGEFETDSDGIYTYQSYWCSNPYNAGGSLSPSGSASTDSIKQKLYSQIIVTYSENDQESEMNTYADAARNNQITIKKIANGIRVEYTLGRAEDAYMVPRVIRYTKFEALYEQILANCT